jgi:hypothetical protein
MNQFVAAGRVWIRCFSRCLTALTGGFGLLDIYRMRESFPGLFPLRMAVSEPIEKARDFMGSKGCQLPKLDVAGSIPVSRSLFSAA